MSGSFLFREISLRRNGVLQREFRRGDIIVIERSGLSRSLVFSQFVTGEFYFIDKDRISYVSAARLRERYVSVRLDAGKIIRFLSDRNVDRTVLFAFHAKFDIRSFGFVCKSVFRNRRNSAVFVDIFSAENNRAVGILREIYETCAFCGGRECRSVTFKSESDTDLAIRVHGVQTIGGVQFKRYVEFRVDRKFVHRSDSRVLGGVRHLDKSVVSLQRTYAAVIDENEFVPVCFCDGSADHIIVF